MSYHYHVDIREWGEDKTLYMMQQMQTAMRMLKLRGNAED